jgi:hypothetical protein
MSRNGSGTYSLPVGNPVVTGTTISSTWANNTLTDIANALTGSLAADGQTTASGNLNMGTYKITNAGDPTNPQDVATKYYVDQLIAALGTMAYQNANLVAITGGAISNVDLNLSSKTNEVYLPKGPTILRTANPVTGVIRYNTTENIYEGYTGGVWVRFQTFPQGVYTVSFLIVAGGGGGGSAGAAGGGGGAGGFITSSLSITPGTTYTMVVGGGGASASAGTNSSITGVAIATGGGFGGTAPGNGGSGGSGGGGGADASTSGGAGVSGQGFSGGGGSTFVGGGGGGGSAVGGNGAGALAGSGGAGFANTLTGTTVYYSGGGGGGAGGSDVDGAGGIGGGGAGGVNGTTNTGGGGGGFNNGVGTGAGGSGVIVVSVPTVNYSGTTTGSPTITISGANTILKFTTSGTYTA